MFLSRSLMVLMWSFSVSAGCLLADERRQLLRHVLAKLVRPIFPRQLLAVEQQSCSRGVSRQRAFLRDRFDVQHDIAAAEQDAEPLQHCRARPRRGPIVQFVLIEGGHVPRRLDVAAVVGDGGLVLQYPPVNFRARQCLNAGGHRVLVEVRLLSGDRPQDIAVLVGPRIVPTFASLDGEPSRETGSTGC